MQTCGRDDQNSKRFWLNLFVFVVVVIVSLTAIAAGIIWSCQGPAQQMESDLHRLLYPAMIGGSFTNFSWVGWFSERSMAGQIFGNYPLVIVGGLGKAMFKSIPLVLRFYNLIIVLGVVGLMLVLATPLWSKNRQ